MPKNLIFLADKLPKPNYDNNNKNIIKEENEEFIEEKNFVSFRENENNNRYKYNVDIKENKKYINSLGNIQPGYNFKKLGIILNSNKIGFMPPFLIKNINNLNNLNLPNIKSDKISLNKRKKNMQKQLVSLDIISKQKNELSKLMLNNNINRKLNYLNNRGYLNPIQMKDLYKLNPNIINKSSPQKIEPNKNRFKYNINNIKKIENEFDYKKNIIYKEEKKEKEKEGPEIKVIPKKKLHPIKIIKKPDE
jgi:hypothetical protein